MLYLLENSHGETKKGLFANCMLVRDVSIKNMKQVDLLRYRSTGEPHLLKASIVLGEPRSVCFIEQYK